MDFEALLSAQIAKAKGGTNGKAASSSSSTTTTSTPTSSAATKKFLKNSEAEEQRRAAYLAEQKAREAEREARAAAKRKREEEAAEEAKAREEKRRRLAEESRRRREEKEAEEERARRRRLGLPELPPGAGAGTKEGTPATGDEDEDEDDQEEPISEEDLTARLRALGEPATLFGETHAQRLRRYRRLATANLPIPTTLRLVPERDMKMPSALPPDRAGRRYVCRQLASYFTMVLREWELALGREERRDTMASRAAFNAMVQSKETMKPLFRKLEEVDLDESILEAIVEIVRAAQERRYVDANDGYLRLSIGKAAWPIGVTMVGIHERSAREKLHAGEKGHVMGDEVTRKYLQSIKRCLTFAQVRWPPEDAKQLMG